MIEVEGALSKIFLEGLYMDIRKYSTALLKCGTISITQTKQAKRNNKNIDEYE
jgi:hypothetical protein